MPRELDSSSTRNPLIPPELALPIDPLLPVIVATAQEDERLEAQLMNAGADDYIHKPLDPARFVARVRAALRRART